MTIADLERRLTMFLVLAIWEYLTFHMGDHGWFFVGVALAAFWASSPWITAWLHRRWPATFQ